MKAGVPSEKLLLGFSDCFSLSNDPRREQRQCHLAGGTAPGGEFTGSTLLSSGFKDSDVRRAAADEDFLEKVAVAVP
jgi:hypothetical protein